MDRVVRCISVWFLVITVLAFVIPCVQAKTFKGKVIDADTKEPIEGAVVVAVWKTERTTPTATHVDLKDVKECLTDKNGEWSISGPKGRADELLPGLSLFIPYTKEPQFTIFKPGYCSWPLGFYIGACKVRIKPEGNKRIREGATIELPKLTKREDRLRGLPSPITKEGDRMKEFYKKQKILLRLIDEESRSLGIPEYKILKELENEK
jgi:hypothetical protein